MTDHKELNKYLHNCYISTVLISIFASPK